MNGDDNTLGAFLFTLLCVGGVMVVASGVRWGIEKLREAQEVIERGLAGLEDDGPVDWRQAEVDAEFDELMRDWRTA